MRLIIWVDALNATSGGTNYLRSWVYCDWAYETGLAEIDPAQ